MFGVDADEVILEVTLETRIDEAPVLELESSEDVELDSSEEFVVDSADEVRVELVGSEELDPVTWDIVEIGMLEELDKIKELELDEIDDDEDNNCDRLLETIMFEMLEVKLLEVLDIWILVEDGDSEARLAEDELRTMEKLLGLLDNWRPVEDKEGEARLAEDELRTIEELLEVTLLELLDNWILVDDRERLAEDELRTVEELLSTLLIEEDVDVPIVDELWTEELLDRVVEVKGVEDDDDSTDDDDSFELEEATELDFDDVETGKDVLVALEVVAELAGRTVAGLTKFVS